MATDHFSQKEEIEFQIMIHIISGKTTFNLIKDQLMVIGKDKIDSGLLAYHLYSKKNIKNCLVGRGIVKRAYTKLIPSRVEYSVVDYDYFRRLLDKKMRSITETYIENNKFLDRIDNLTKDTKLALCYQIDIPATSRTNLVFRSNDLKNINPEPFNYEPALYALVCYDSEVEKERIVGIDGVIEPPQFLSFGITEDDIKKPKRDEVSDGEYHQFVVRKRRSNKKFVKRMKRNQLIMYTWRNYRYLVDKCDVYINGEKAYYD